MKKVFNLERVPSKFMDDPRGKSAMTTKYLGALAGSERLYVNVDYLKPGAKSAKYHSHTKQEEFFLVLKGTGTLRLAGKQLRVKAGDFVSKPGGKGLCHQFINTGKNVLAILDCGTKDRGDRVNYPDEGVVLIKDKRKVLKNGRPLAGWTADPNE